jgi:hypothetical protein
MTRVHTKTKATNNQIENPIMRNYDVIMPATMQQTTSKTIPILSCLFTLFNLSSGSMHPLFVSFTIAKTYRLFDYPVVELTQ